MSFFAYSASHDDELKIDYKTYNQAAGVIGTLLPTSAPMATADDRDSITEKAYAHVGRNPSDRVYITDSEGLIYAVVSIYNERVNKLEGWLFAAVWLFVVSVICFLTTIVFGFGVYGFLVFAVVAFFFMLQILNNVNRVAEGAVPCTIFLILLYLLLPAITKSLKQQKALPKATSSAGHIANAIQQF